MYDAVTIKIEVKESNLASIPDELKVEANGHTRISKSADENIIFILKYYIE